MACMAVAIDGLSHDGGGLCARLDDILIQVHEATHKVNEVSSPQSLLFVSSSANLLPSVVFKN